jgi:hypothetical protein
MNESNHQEPFRFLDLQKSLPSLYEDQWYRYCEYAALVRQEFDALQLYIERSDKGLRDSEELKKKNTF